MQNYSLKNTHRKIAIFFSLLSSGLIIAVTFLTMLLVRLEINTQSKTTLEKALKTVVSDYNADQLSDKTTNIQKKSRSDTAFENIYDERNSYVAPIPQSGLTGNEDLTELQKSREVYSRVIKSNGDIIFTSDLYQQNYVEYQEGFSVINSGNICIYNLNTKITSGKNAGSIVSVGQYCPFSYSQQNSLFLKLLGFALFLLISTYFIGLYAANKLLKPIEKSMTQTRQFAQNVYHELFTPLTVAMTTVDAAEKTGDYKKGIMSLNEDLKEMYNALEILKKSNLKQEECKNQIEVNITEILEEVIKENSKDLEKRKLKFDLDEVDKNINKKSDQTAVKLIFQNLVTNAIKYSKADSIIKINLNKKQFHISNEVESKKDIDIKKFFERNYRGENSKNIDGNGLGLSIVKELAESLGWKVKAKISDIRVQVEIKF